eukprot:gene13644-13767_t
MLAKCTLHSERAAQQWEMEVPLVVYDRSMFMFATAFCIDVLTVGFEFKSSRLDMVILPAFVKGMATLTNALSHGATVCLLDAHHANHLAAGENDQQQHHQAADFPCHRLCGADACHWVGGFPLQWWGSRANSVVSLRAAGWTMSLLVYGMTMVMWVMFGVIWDLKMFGLVSTATEEVVNLCCDFAAKVMFSCGLMLSNFKGADSRREGVMRQIQESHRQTLIQELRRVIQQKDAFMSSVSHELRTPLNGIIGISEGLLSGCCGILNQSVRRQIYIMRTSGARLLALINDVMDAAALRQHRLVLKQESMDLRQIVGDVTDLTRSLVSQLRLY